ncbi:MAG: hypothetical protein H7343_20460 [Undibacterium sp.]|nr:hypothetical protein [Opitutaceae bacterium]
MGKILTTAFFCLLISCCRGAINTPFNGETYALAWVNVSDKDGTITNEFLRKGETLKNWKIMVSARYFPHSKTTNEIASSWIVMLRKSTSPGVSITTVKLEGKTDLEELMFSASIRAPDDSYLELCYCRIVKEPWAEGVKMYQVSRRVDPNNKKQLMAAFMADATISEQVKTMFIEAVTKRQEAIR